VFEAEGLTKHFDTSGPVERFLGDPEPVRAVDGIDIEIDSGSTVGLVGESGCGKSTAARALLRLIEPTDGDVTYRETDVTGAGSDELRSLRRDLQIVFQDPQSSLNPRRTVRQIVRRPMDLHGIGSQGDRPDRVVELIDAVGLDASHLERYPHELSGGQQQRVGIARALAVNPEVIILDEPVSGLDVSVQAQILNLLADLQEELGLVYLLISHDLSVVEYVCDRVAVMYLGQIVEHGPTAEVFEPPYHPYTESLLSAIPGTEQSGDRILLEGNVPDPSNVPSGCRFHPRCPRKIGEVCETEEPTDHAVDGETIGCHLLRDEYADEVDWNTVD
jgi:peptide/nickel transport system ATP-binding protein